MYEFSYIHFHRTEKDGDWFINPLSLAFEIPTNADENAQKSNVLKTSNLAYTMLYVKRRISQNEYGFLCTYWLC